MSEHERHRTSGEIWKEMICLWLFALIGAIFGFGFDIPVTHYAGMAIIFLVLLRGIAVFVEICRAPTRD